MARARGIEAAPDAPAVKFVAPAPAAAAEPEMTEEEAILASLRPTQALASAAELASGKMLGGAAASRWVGPRWLRECDPSRAQKMRNDAAIVASGARVPPPAPRFQDCKVPTAMLAQLAEQGVVRPTPVQQQALPVILAGRDCIGIAATGSGKTLAFGLPAVLFAMEEERRLPLTAGEGPTSLILVPSRELAAQTDDVVKGLCKGLADAGLPSPRSALLTGGIKNSDQAKALEAGVHIVSATPGRLIDVLNKGTLTLDLCRYLVLDEADRMISESFEDDMRNVFGFFRHARQTALFSATMPQRIQEFARTALHDPVVVNVGRAGATNMDVIQVRFVRCPFLRPCCC